MKRKVGVGKSMTEPPVKQRRFLRRLREWSRQQKAASDKRRSEYLYLSGNNRWRRLLINLHPESLFSFFTSQTGLWLVFKMMVTALCLLTLLVTFAYFYYRREAPATVLELQSCLEAQVIEFYDQEGQTLIWAAHEGHECRPVGLDEVNPYFIDALISTEDKDFFEHPGYKMTSIARSAINNMLGRPLQGGSTITQQYIKNAILQDTARSWERKIKEMVLIPEIESLYSKEEILTAYLNTIYLSNDYSGIEAASVGYFGRPAAELTLDEAAYLVASIGAPVIIWDNPQTHELRRDIVLGEMLEDGKIKQAEYERALAVDTTAKLLSQDAGSPKGDIKHAPYFALEARRQLDELVCGIGESACKSLPQGNYKVITTLNLGAQTIIERTLNEALEESDPGFDNAALVVINNHSREVLAMSGGRDFQNTDFGQINNIARPRPPGNLWHPVIYAALLKNDSQWGAGRLFYDYPTFEQIESEDYLGSVSLRQALAESVTTPTVKAASLTSGGQINSLAQGLHLDYLMDCQANCALLQARADGFNVRLDNLANVYATLAVGGSYSRPAYVKQVLKDGEEIVYERQSDDRRILNSETAFMINDILADRNYWTSGPTTQGTLAFKADFSGQFRDNAFITYTPGLTVGGWVGQQIHLEEPPEETAAQKAQSLLVEKFFENWGNPLILETSWTKPGSLRSLQTNPLSGLLGSDTGQNDYYPGSFRASELPIPMTILLDKASGQLATGCTPPLALTEFSSGAFVPELADDHPDYLKWMTPVWQNLGRQLDSRIPSQTDSLHTCNDQPPKSEITAEGDCNQSCQLIIRVTAGSHDLRSVTVRSATGDMTGITYSVSDRQAEIRHTYSSQTQSERRLRIDVLDQGFYQTMEFFEP